MPDKAAIFPVTGRAEVSETLRVPLAMLKRFLELAPGLTRKKVAKGKTIYSQGEICSQAYVVVSGRVGITMLSASGHELMIDIVGRGALCGEGAAFDGLPRFSSANALEACELLSISASEFCNLMASDAALAGLVAQTIALKQRTLAARLAQIAQSSPELRITELLSQISEPEALDVMLTHQQIASLIGASRITVTRAMQRLRKEGAIRCHRGRYQLVRTSAPYLQAYNMA